MEQGERRFCAWKVDQKVFLHFDAFLKPSSWQGGPPEIKSSEIKLDRLIGVGSFGKVYGGTCRGSRVAIKVPAKKLSAEEVQELRQEVAILSSIYHPNVVLFMGACTREEEVGQELMIVTELKDCTVESLLKSERERRRNLKGGGQKKGSYMSSPMKAGGGGVVGSGQHLSPSSSHSNSHHSPTSATNQSILPQSTFMSSPLARIRMARDTALGTNWLHNICHIIHRDLKTANLLYDSSSGRVCVTDFGLSQALAPHSKAKDRFGARGSALFMAPEVIKEEEFDHRIDIYSFGIILWELWTCEEPFSEFYDFDTFVDAVHVRGLRPPIGSQLFGIPTSEGSSSSTPDDVDLKKTCPAKLVDLIKSCWHSTPSKRPSDFESILHSLDEIIVDLTLGAANNNGTWMRASQFWFESFCKDDLVESVPWNEFIAALENHTNLKQRKADEMARGSQSSFFSSNLSSGSSSSFSSPPISQLSFDLLAPLLTSVDGTTVTLTQFADVVEWFGHWYDPDLCLYTLSQIHQILNSEWFAGAITRQQAEAHVNSRTQCPLPDSFLVRLSASFPGCPFTITRPSYSTRRPNLRVKRIPFDPSKAPPSHSHQIDHHPFLFVVDYGPDGTSRAFTSLVDLINGLKSELRLLNPAPPFSSSTGGY